jgi:ribokinase
MKVLNIPPERWRYRAMIGVGGIGSGRFFAIHGDKTLTREESRGGHFLDRRDYCKLHIIAHYVGTLLGPRFATIPVGKVGDDDTGRKLLVEMQEAGLDLRTVRVSPGEQTLFSFCFLYPDGSGGNLTTDDSALARLDRAFVLSAEEDFRRHAGAGIALAVPEVPLDARAALISLGSTYGFLRAASFTSNEIPEAMSSGLIRELDLIALNRDEAAAICGVSPGQTAADEIARRAVARISSEAPRLRISITAGREGSWIWDGQSLRHAPSISVPVQGTAGAGDAHLAGIIVGLVAGLGWTETQQFATLLAALSVTSPHTIHPGIDRDALRHLAERAGVLLAKEVNDMLGDVD